MLSRVYSAQVTGLNADIIDVEVDICQGLFSFSIVGLPDKAVEESKDRILAAIKNSGLEMEHRSGKKILVSLAPADIRKEGPIFDLAIALGHILASDVASFATEKRLFLGELSLDGKLRPIKGMLVIARKAKATGFTELYVPRANAEEAALVRGIRVYPCSSLEEVVGHLERHPQKRKAPIIPQEETECAPTLPRYNIDFGDVRGQETAKRGLEIAAAGGHNIAMSGPPGTGKTMLAKAFIGILPPMSFDEMLEVTGIHSATGTLENNLVTYPPFRSPHHTSSYVSLVGGGSWPRPGEITLAHRGVLFLDEFPEFDRKVIEALRQPLEDRVITVSRARGTIKFPASFILIATMNPCPCGNKGHKTKECICNPTTLARYARKISGPIIDRIDMWLDVPSVEHRKLSENKNSGETSTAIRARVLAAREIQAARFAGLDFTKNSEMGVRDLKKFAYLDDTSTDLLNKSAERYNLSARAYHRIIKLARTIADLGGSDNIESNHLMEALNYRPKSNK